SSSDSIYFGNPGGEISVARNFWDASQRSKTQELISTIGEPVYAIEVDSRDRLWIGAKSGIRVLGGNGQPLATYETGLFDQISVDYGASHITSDGIVFFGGSGGLIRIDTQEPLNIRSRSALYLSQVTLGERTHTLSNQRSLLRSILITEQDQPIEIVLRADILSSRYRRGVRFILEGFDSNWTNSGPDNSASYKHLPPGDYVFRARGADSFGVWSQNEIALPIHVKPPAWLSWWAFVGYAVLALAFAWLVKELNDRRVVAAVRRERAEDEAAAFARLQDDFQAQLEDNERLRGASVERAQRLLDVLSDAVDAKAQDQRDQGNAGADKELSEQIDCLRLAQSVTHSIAGRECCDLHAFVNELSTRLSSRGRQFANTIVINDVSAQPIDAGHSLYLALILYETLHQAYQNTLANKELGAIVTVTLPSPELDGTGELRYELRVTDNGVHLKQERMHTAGGAFIAHLQEAGIAEAHVSHEIGTEVLIGFHLPGDESRAT
ncbi:MAG: two-component sensor histidine kinase, partial [Halieaceae bacterium]